MTSGPLAGLRVVELAGAGPAPFAAMLFADMGADVVRLDRITAPSHPLGPPPENDLLNRGRRSVAIDLRHPSAPAVVLRMVERADALIEGFRAGVAERLGVGPGPCRERNPRLVYGRMTGFGQDGPLAAEPGHDINYLALSGALSLIGPAEGPPIPPVNLVADFGAGGLLLAFGMLCAIVEAQQSEIGQVVDAAMTEGAALLTTFIHGMRASGRWVDRRAANIPDGGAPFYGVYETADGRYVSVASAEPKFYASLLRVLGLADDPELSDQLDTAKWPQVRDRLAAAFRTRTSDEWCAAMAGQEVCFAPVLSVAEAPHHPHNLARNAFVSVAGVVQPAPAPKLGRTPGTVLRPPPAPGEHTNEVLAEWGFGRADIERLRTDAVIA